MVGCVCMGVPPLLLRAPKAYNAICFKITLCFYWTLYTQKREYQENLSQRLNCATIFWNLLQPQQPQAHRANVFILNMSNSNIELILAAAKKNNSKQTCESCACHIILLVVFEHLAISNVGCSQKNVKLNVSSKQAKRVATQLSRRRHTHFEGSRVRDQGKRRPKTKSTASPWTDVVPQHMARLNHIAWRTWGNAL